MCHLKVVCFFSLSLRASLSLRSISRRFLKVPGVTSGVTLNTLSTTGQIDNISWSGLSRHSFSEFIEMNIDMVQSYPG